MSKVLKVLAVADPAVYGYVDDKYKILSKFNEDNKEFTVDFHIVPWNDYYSTMMETFEGKRDYDIVMVAGHLWLKDFVDKGFLAEVDKDYDEKYNYEDILPIIREEIEINKVQYLYPSFCDGHVVLYRKSITEKILGKYPENIINTDELVDMAWKCNGYNGMKGIVLKAHPSEIFLDFLPYLRNEGLDAVDEGTGKPTFNNEKAENAFRKYMSLKAISPESTSTFGNEEVKNAFQRKQSLFAVTWGGQLGVILGEDCIEKEDIGFSALNTSWNVTWSFGINKLSNKKLEANKFLRYITSKEIDRIIGSYAGSPVRKSTYLEDRDKYSWYDMHLELIQKYAQPLPSLSNAGAKFGVIYEALTKAFGGEITIKDALKEAEDKFIKL